MCAGPGEQRVHEIVDVPTTLCCELVSDLIDGCISLASYRLNQIVKVLTIISMIFVPLGLPAGSDGMEFEKLPDLHSPAGHGTVMGIIVLIATTLLLIFRKKKWL